MIQMGMSKENIQFVGFQIPAQPIHSSPGVQNHSARRNRQARRVPPIAGMISGGAQEDEFHGGD